MECPNCKKEMIWLTDEHDDDQTIVSTYTCQECGTVCYIPIDTEEDD